MFCNLKYERQLTSEVKIKNTIIGGSQPILVQSMTDTHTDDIEGCLKQSRSLIENGAGMLRFTTQGEKELNALSVIKKRLQAQFDIPIVADVHFRSEIADKAAEIADKVRINPGNYSNHPSEIKAKFSRFLSLCKAKKVAVRIGVNYGSLSNRIVEQYGNTAKGMVMSCMEFLTIARDCNFSDIVLSVKASDCRLMYDAVRSLRTTMEEANMQYPLHVGVTEAGFGEDGRIKSSVGIGAVLAQGLGDTIRVSLSESPVNELPVARWLIDYFVSPESNRYRNVYVKIEDGKVLYKSDCSEWEKFMIEAASECGHFLWDAHCDGLVIENSHFSREILEKLSLDILQAAGIIRYKNEYVSCPGCGRTMFDLQKTAVAIKEATSHLTGLKIAIMGCIVNGIGEMGDADYGYVGAGRNRVSLYKKKQCVLSNIPQEQAVEKLLALIENKLN